MTWRPVRSFPAFIGQKRARPRGITAWSITVVIWHHVYRTVEAHFSGTGVCSGRSTSKAWSGHRIGTGMGRGRRSNRRATQRAIYVRRYPSHAVFGRIAEASDTGGVEGRDPAIYSKEACAPLIRTSWCAFWPATIPSRFAWRMISWQQARGSRSSRWPRRSGC